MYIETLKIKYICGFFIYESISEHLPHYYADIVLTNNYCKNISMLTIVRTTCYIIIHMYFKPTFVENISLFKNDWGPLEYLSSLIFKSLCYIYIQLYNLTLLDLFKYLQWNSYYEFNFLNKYICFAMYMY